MPYPPGNIGKDGKFVRNSLLFDVLESESCCFEYLRGTPQEA
jgi:hypothetical protein